MESAPRHLETERLLLRPFTGEDYENYAAMCADAEVMRGLGSGVPMDRTEAWRHLAFAMGHWELRGFGWYAVERRDDGEFVGRVGFLQPEEWPGFELGWTLVRAHWGHGYATEAARACRDTAFDLMGVDHLVSLIVPENHRSIAVAQRIGERFEEEIDWKGRHLHVYGTRRP